MSSLYATLGVRRNASIATVRAAYRTLAKTAHPDAGGSEAAFAELKRAHDILSDPERRKRYDETGEIQEPQLDNEMAEVYQIIAQLLGAVLGSKSDPTAADLVRAMKDQIGEHMRNAQQQIAGLDAQASRADELAKRFRVKDGSVNHIVSILASQAAQMRQGIKNIEHAIETHRKAIKVLDGYAFDAKAQQQFVTLRTGSGTATGTGGVHSFRFG